MLNQNRFQTLFLSHDKGQGIHEFKPHNYVTLDHTE